MDEACKTFGLPDYRSSYGCLRCFQRKTRLWDFAAPVKTRDHDWLLRIAENDLSIHPVTANVVEDIKKTCSAKRKHAGVIFPKKLSRNLCRGDRLEPACAGMVDFWHDQPIDDASPSECQMLIYRKKKNSLMFISKLFTVDGIQPGIPGLTMRHFLFDRMHVMELGVLLNFEGFCLHLLAKEGFFGMASDPDSLNYKMKRSFTAFWNRYKREGDKKPYLDFSKAADKDGESNLKKFKAWEARKVLSWVVLLLKHGGSRHLDSIKSGLGENLLTCGTNLEEFYKVCDSQPRKMHADVLQQLEIIALECVRAWTRTGKSTTMKWHILGRHLVEQMEWAGNCSWSHNYKDESTNFEAGEIGRATHALKHNQNFLTRWYLKHMYLQSNQSRQSRVAARR